MTEYSSYNQTELFRQLATGSQPALERIVQLNEKIMMREIKQIVQNQELAKEVCSDTIHTLWENRKEVAEKANPVAWLVVTARHKAINKIRDEKRKATYPISMFNNIPGPLNIELEMEAKELNELIQKAVEKLSPGQKIVYALVIKDGLNRKEIAQQLNISEHTVKNQLRNAMLSLRKHLSKLMSSIVI